MALTNAERQRRHRERQREWLATAERKIQKLKAKLSEYESNRQQQVEDAPPAQPNLPEPGSARTQRSAHGTFADKGRMDM
jgi:hypothetical protein